MDNPMDIALLKGQLEGITAKGKELRINEAKFLKAKGLDEEFEKAKKESLDEESSLYKMKKKLDEMVKKKNAAVQKSIQGVVEKMAEVLPDGIPVFEITDTGSLTIGWDFDGSYRPYEGLSGGEKVQFNLAIAHAMNAGILIMEAAEVDDKSLLETLFMLSSVEKQVIVSTCHTPDGIPDEWVHISLGGV
jgi:ATPase subunit of ABC transporter with duplicated ATPase domains